MVVDDIEDDFEARVVQPRDHLFEFAQRIRHVERVARIRREEADGIVAPVVPQAFFQQMTVVEEGMNRQQLDRGDAERLDVVDRPFDAKPA